jgi:ADP-ribose pyrophosphatase YjhB (NUDIX family)
MAAELDGFLKSHPDFVEEIIQWGPLQFTVRSFLCSEKPPINFVTSVKAIILQQRKILVVQDPESVHILPGGRCEPDELWEDTLRREIAEETGWRLGTISMLGVRHFHHLTPKPADYKYPYPDFCQVIFKAEALEHIPSTLDPNRYELGAKFLSLTETLKLDLTPCERHFLNAAISG